MKDTTGNRMTCTVCGKEIGSMSYIVNDQVYCPECYCKKFGVCG